VREILDAAETTFYSVAWSPDGTTIAFGSYACPSDEHAPYCQRGTHSLMTTTVAGADNTTLAEVTGDRLVWSPDGRRLAFEGDGGVSEGGGGIYVMEADGSHLVRLADGSAPRWSPDSQWLLFTPSVTSEQPFEALDQLWIVAADGGDARLLGNYGAGGW
jgi:Tol biopolymer transport system component